jgi:hypothetical protein
VYRFFGVRAIARIAHRVFHDAVPAFTYERIECTALTGLGAQNKTSIARLHIYTQFQFRKGLSEFPGIPSCAAVRLMPDRSRRLQG